LKIKAVLTFEMGGGTDYPVMQNHVQEERILNNTAVIALKLTVFNHQFTFSITTHLLLTPLFERKCNYKSTHIHENIPVFLC
jgi:hypothetical protein